MFFLTENDKGTEVIKFLEEDEVRRLITLSLLNCGYVAAPLTLEQTGNIEVKATVNGNSMLFHFGGFDGYEVLEPDNFTGMTKERVIPPKFSYADKLQKLNEERPNELRAIADENYSRLVTMLKVDDLFEEVFGV